MQHLYHDPSTLSSKAKTKALKTPLGLEDMLQYYAHPMLTSPPLSHRRDDSCATSAASRTAVDTIGRAFVNLRYRNIGVTEVIRETRTGEMIQ